MDVLTSIWAAALHVPLVIRHFLALLAPALAVILIDRWLRTRA